MDKLRAGTRLRDGAVVSSVVSATKTPHEALSKSVFLQPENAAAELQHVLAPEYVSGIVWSTLKLESPGLQLEQIRAILKGSICG